MDKKTPLLSICIASYNYGTKLKRAFEAILEQEYKNWELIYCDDASTDDSVDIIESFIRSNPNRRIKLINNSKNRGLIYTKNKLIKEAKGEYIMLCDADDYMLPNCLKAIMNQAINLDADRVCAQIVNKNDSGKILQIQRFAKNQSKWLWNIHHGSIYRKSIIEEHDIKITEEPDDVDFITKFNCYATRTVWLTENLYVWSIHTDSAGKKSISIKDSKMQFRGICNSIKSAYDFICSRSECEGIFETCSKAQNQQQLLLLYIKIYYLFVLRYDKNINFAVRRKLYEELKEVIYEFYPDYLTNKLVYKRNKYIREYAFFIIKLCACFERIHFFEIALWVYQVLSKIKYFDQ